jgi:hypothetical protein
MAEACELAAHYLDEQAADDQEEYAVFVRGLRALAKAQ